MDKLRHQWPNVSLNKFLTKVRRGIDVQPQKLYSQIGIRSHGKGVFHKEPMSGKEIGGKNIFWIEPGDFVLNIVFAWEGAVALISENEKGMCASHRFPTFVPDRTLCDPEYLLRYFQTPIGVEQLGLCSPGGAGRNRTLNQSEFLSLSIPLPPLAEQRKITAILGTWDAAIATVEQLIAALQARKQGLMQRLLTGEVRFQEFEGSEWDAVKLGDLGACIRGVSYSPDTDLRPTDDENTVRLLRANNIASGQINTDSLQFVLREKCRDEQLLSDGDIAVCMASGSKDLVGKAAAFDDDEEFTYTVGAFCAIFRPYDSARTSYLRHLLQSVTYQKQLHVMSSGSSINNLKPSDVESMTFVLPCLREEQVVIGDFFDTMAAEEETLSQLRTSYQLQKQALMQQLLTGQVRVKVGEENLGHELQIHQI